MTETEDNLKSISWIRKNINVKLKTLNKIIKILNLNPTIRTNKFGEQTEYYDLNKIKEFINSHDINHVYSVLQISKIIGVGCTSINSVIKYLNLDKSEFLCDEELNKIKQFYKEHEDNYRYFFQNKTNLEKYGSLCPLANKEIQKKAEETCLEKYGVKNYAETKEFKTKFKQISLERYGTEFPMQNEEIKEKGKQTSLERYGVKYASQNKDFRKRVEQTNLEKYGTKCSLHSYEAEQKTKQTNLERYGVENVSQSEIIKEKVKNTNLKNFGVEHATQNEKIKEKTKQTNLKNLGVEYPTQNKDVMNKIKQSNLKKFGVECSLQNKEIRDKVARSYLKKLEHAKSQNLYCVKDLAIIFNKSESTITMDLKRLNINVVKFEKDFRVYVKQSDLKILEDYFINTECSGISYSEKEIVEFIKSIYSDEIIENSRSIISPKELDIYIPQKNLAIEYDGLYWHDENHIENNYHLNKTKLCNKKGIDLIHVFEDDWLERKEIVKSMIASRLGVYKEKIFARKCQIKEIEKDQAKIFFNENHLQGFAYGDLYLGLVFNNELIQCICINKKGWHDGNVELTRMVTKLNTQVIGGFSKLVKHISDYIEYKSITSYVYKAWFNGKGYNESGFTIVKENNPSYFYIVNGKRIHKSHFRKDKIKKMFERGELEFYDSNKTEHENMIENKIYRIYDCGTIKVIYE